MKKFDELEEQISKLEAEREHWREVALRTTELTKVDQVSPQKVVHAPHPYTIKGRFTFPIRRNGSNQNTLASFNRQIPIPPSYHHPQSSSTGFGFELEGRYF
jgi:hypothetical protein